MAKVFELVTATIRLERGAEFHQLHEEVFLPILEKYGVKPLFLSETYVGGEVGKFYDIYEYPSWEAYRELTELVRADPKLASYYKKITPCILGTIDIKLLEPMRYSPIR